ncbi:MAG: MFS transporter [Leptospiraceae bacterium]|nr:MFS transporter [Leptospiraceae bacterium]
MMGFSIIFPLFPRLLEHYLAKGKDSFLESILNLARFLGGDESNAYLIILFGGILGSIYSILQFFFSPIWGKVSDNIGRKPVLIATSLGNFLGYILWLYSGSFTIFVLSRVITGIMGGNISVASAAMADSTNESERARGMGMIGAGIGLGFVFGPPLSGLLSGLDLNQYFPFGFTIFSASILLGVFIAFLNLLLIFFLFEETLTGLDVAPSRHGTGIHPVFGLSKSGVKELPLLSLIYFLFTFAFSGFEFCINFYLDGVYHFDPRQIGYTFVFIGIIIIFIQGGVIRRISGKISEKLISFFGAANLFLGLILIAFSKSIPISFLALSFISMGSAFLHPGLSSLASLFSSREEQGKNLGILRGFGALARALSPLCFSILYFRLQHQLTFIISAVIILGVILFIRILDDSEYNIH